MSVAIIIPNYNGLSKLGSYLFKCMDSILALRYDNFDVFFVDNGSNDGSAQAVEDHYGKDVIVLRLSRNYGFSGGIVKALEIIDEVMQKRYDYIALVNNDFLITNDESLHEFVNFLEKKNDVAAVQGMILCGDGRTIQNAGFFVDAFLNNIPRYCALSVSEHPDGEISYVSFTSGAYALLNVKHLVATQRYPDLFNKLFFAYWDDADLGLYLWSKGLKSVALPISGGIHLEAITAGKKSSLHEYLNRRNSMLVLRTYWCRGILGKFKALIMFRMFVANMYKALLGQRLYFRALHDGMIMRATSLTLTYHPLLIIPTSYKEVIRSTLPDAIRYRGNSTSYVQRYSTLFITDQRLKNLSTPYLLYQSQNQ